MHDPRVQRRWTARLVCAQGLVWAAPLGAAQTPASGFTTPVRVQMDAEADCSSADAFFDAVRKRSSRVRPAEPAEAAALLDVKLDRAGTNVNGDLKLRREDGTVSTRHVTGVSCQAVVDALSLTAALAVTFPFNIVIGIPLYERLAAALAG